ncbi:alpha/beta fold hydrolase [Oricola thermophila]|uniref:Alpha/beta hydrolase n=1 Tax=Oricola thermophila TaxID=2742145 RepID=A0A6N1V8N5_9HYPH|nr:alpha/beta hydrolase [Oricola thermophila]QKV17290.1 alpha/beta hydrolase [Oricola thermophila]
MAAETLVLVPGLLSDSVVWQPLADAAAGRFSVHVADVSRGTSITGMAETILGETDGPLIVVGHSMGGRVAMEMARLAPGRVKGLVLANTGHHPKREGEETRRQAMIDLGHESMERLAAQWLPPMVDPARTVDGALMEMLTAMVLRADAAQHERQIRALIGRPNASAYLEDVACPVLLVAARQDAWSPIAQHEEIGAAVADSEMVVIEDAGHFAPVERPAETTTAIMEWLVRRFGDGSG